MFTFSFFSLVFHPFVHTRFSYLAWAIAVFYQYQYFNLLYLKVISIERLMNTVLRTEFTLLKRTRTLTEEKKQMGD